MSLPRIGTPQLKAMIMACLVLCYATLIGCAQWGMQPSSNALDTWSITGKIGVRTPKESMAGFLTWQQNQHAFDIYVSGPLAQGATRIIGDLNTVTIEQGGQTKQGIDPQQLIWQELGWQFPLSNLKHWLTGNTAPESNAQIIKQGNRLESFKQDGWTVNYLRFDEYYNLPERIRISQGDWRFTIIVKTWSV